MLYENLRVVSSNYTLTLTIDRESKLNALNKSTLSELHHALSEAQEDPSIKGVLITGQGSKAFAAGADISEFAHYSPSEGYNLAQEGQAQVFDFIHHYPKPVVAAVNGFALGGGLELALACHIRIASEQAKFGLPEVSLGLIPGYGGTQRLTHLIGRGRSMELILSGSMVDAQTALQFGMINKVVTLEHLLPACFSFLEIVYTRSSMAVAAAIQAINAAHTAAGFEVEKQAFSQRFGTADFQEGVAAFLEKRKPSFK